MLKLTSLLLFVEAILPLLEVICLILPALLSIAYVTVAERKTMASMQRRLGPNVVGYYGLLQAFADALKLILKEYVAPTQANIFLFFLGPVITLIFSLLGYAVIPYAPGLSISDLDLGILYILAVSSVATYGILLAGWSANSKYAFLGSLRSVAQLISYELVLSSAILIIVMITNSFNLNTIVQYQKIIWFIVPLFPIFLIFFIGSVAETNRAPFDLAEAESELVSGFMTEHAAVIFVFFFLAEYGSILLMCILISILFLGGYLIPGFLIQFIDMLFLMLNFFIKYTIYILNYNTFLWNTFFELTQIKFNFFNNIMYIDSFNYYIDWQNHRDLIISKIYNNSLAMSLIYSLTLGLKTSIMVFIFIWVRASFPRIRFDQLMYFCWTVILPILFAFIIFTPCLLFEFDSILINCNLM